MVKKKIQQDKDVTEAREKPRFYVTFADTGTEVLMQAGTNEIEKFTKTDLMKMVNAFKTEVAAEEKNIEAKKKQAEKELNESDKRSSGNASKRVRRSHKTPKS